MRNDLVESLWIGGGIGLLILAIHALTTGAPPQAQLLALLAAAILIACAQIGVTIWRQRRGDRTGSPPAAIPPGFARLRRSRRNPFFRELTSDWTGLDEHLADDERPKPAGPPTPPADERPKPPPRKT
jgi:hypothetical protein